jgi:hypothetical protein
MKSHTLKTMLGAVASAVIATVGLSLLPASAASAATTSLREPTVSVPVSQRAFTTEQQAALANATSTPAKRADVLKKLELAYAGVATVGFRSATTSSSNAYSAGWDRDHFWIILSYADAANGAITTAAGACVAYLPALWWVCGGIAGFLYALVNGWGRASNHGVWAAVYTSGWLTGGRW